MARFGDRPVTYAVFLRRPVISAPRLMLDWLDERGGGARDARSRSICAIPKGSWVGAGEPIVYITGSLRRSLSDLETILLQKLGPACVAAHNAYPDVPGAAAGGVPGDGGAALRRRRDGRR